MKKIVLYQHRHLSSQIVKILCRLAMGALLAFFTAAPVQAEGPSEDELKQANNPLANMKAFNIQDFYVPKLYDLPDESSNTAWARFVFPTGKVLWRASLPVSTVPTAEESVSGLGDFNIFAAYLFTNQFGLGPLLAAPTATDDVLGSGKWQAGLTAVYFNTNSAIFQFGGLGAWQTSFAGDEDREDTNLMTIQTFAFWQLGKGTYVRSAPVWVFNLEDNTYNVPFGLGIGKVIKAGNQVYNLFIEPQYTILHEGVGQPELQIFTGVNIQFLSKKKE